MNTIPIRNIAASPAAHAGRFTIRNLQQILDGKDLVHELHKHDFFFLLAISKGSGLHEIDFISYPVRDNTIFILRPGQVHRLELAADSEGFLMEFDLAFYRPKNTISEHRWRKASGKNYCEVEAVRFKKLYDYLAAVFNENSHKQEGYLEAINANLDLFFIEFIRQSQNPGTPATSQNGHVQERFEEFMRLMESKIGSMKNVSDYAGLLNLSSYQLNAITKASVGKTVSDLLNEQIILEAKRYLVATFMQIKEVADQLGYDDVSYFIRFFKKHTGQSPEMFRKNFK